MMIFFMDYWYLMTDIHMYYQTLFGFLKQGKNLKLSSAAYFSRTKYIFTACQCFFTNIKRKDNSGMKQQNQQCQSEYTWYDPIFLKSFFSAYIYLPVLVVKLDILMKPLN